MMLQWKAIEPRQPITVANHHTSNVHHTLYPHHHVLNSHRHTLNPPRLTLQTPNTHNVTLGLDPRAHERAPQSNFGPNTTQTPNTPPRHSRPDRETSAARPRCKNTFHPITPQLPAFAQNDASQYLSPPPKLAPYCPNVRTIKRECTRAFVRTVGEPRGSLRGWVRYNKFRAFPFPTRRRFAAKLLTAPAGPSRIKRSG